MLLHVSVIISMELCKLQVLKKKYSIKYYYDIERTKIEAYQHSWQMLNQVATSQTVPSPVATSVTYTNQNRYNNSQQIEGLIV